MSIAVASSLRAGAPATLSNRSTSVVARARIQMRTGKCSIVLFTVVSPLRRDEPARVHSFARAAPGSFARMLVRYTRSLGRKSARRVIVVGRRCDERGTVRGRRVSWGNSGTTRGILEGSIDGCLSGGRFSRDQSMAAVHEG